MNRIPTEKLTTVSDGSLRMDCRVAEMYDEKTLKQGLNLLLAEEDGYFFNHNGLIFPDESISFYQSRVGAKTSLESILHQLEKNTVTLGCHFLKQPSKEALGLDAGCGAGGSSLMIHEKFGCKMEGFTLSKEQAEYANQAVAQKGYDQSLKFSQGDMLGIKRPDATYDFIWACESTEHVSDLRTMFEKFNQLIKPGGIMVIIAWIAKDRTLKTKVDEHYLTNIHCLDDYLNSCQENWNLLNNFDLTALTAPYWKIRSQSQFKTGAEEFMEPGFTSGDIEYRLLAMKTKKDFSL